MDKPALTEQPIHPLIAGRWSPRSFDPDRDVDARTLTGLIEAARWAPSCANEQPWRFAVGARGEGSPSAQRWQAIYDALDVGNQLWCRHAAAFVVMAATRTFEKNGQSNRYAWHDVGAAGVSLALEAHARGLGSHPMAGWDADRLRAGLDLPESLDLVAVWAIGWPASADALPEPFLGRELAPRSRRPLADFMV